MNKLLIVLLTFSSFFSNAAIMEHGVEELRFRESTPQTAHKYYLSVSNIKYNTKAGALQMTSRFFIDDLEDVLSARADQEIVLTQQGSLDKHKSLIGNYFRAKLKVKIDGQALDISYLGSEIETDQIVMYIEIPVAQEPSEVEMLFTALFELFEEQKNMVHFKIKGQRKTLLTDLSKKIDIVKF